MSYTDQSNDPYTVSVSGKTLAVIVGIGALVVLNVALIYFFLPRPPDPGIVACGRLKAHANAGTRPSAAERTAIVSSFRRSDVETLAEAGESEFRRTDPVWNSMIRGGGLPSIGPDGAPIIPPGSIPDVDLTDYRLLTTACRYADAY
ncbi:hypothetical protein [Catenuloplanes japonicus]|uniref:hypothetical protein n=1 Tax=Catenuloplanes japonicus TaxID=33876 RepID=UPI00052785E1|nr:hypothetical protein [Catenuloplanes japonicus]